MGIKSSTGLRVVKAVHGRQEVGPDPVYVRGPLTREVIEMPKSQDDIAINLMGSFREDEQPTMPRARSALTDEAPISRQGIIAKSRAINLVPFLLRSEFLERLRIEKRRADRSKSALSIIVLSFNKHPSDRESHLIGVLTMLKTLLRETDIVGFVDQSGIGILLPETGKEGVQYISRKIHNGGGNTRVTIASGTYPDQLFDALQTQERVQPHQVSYVLEDPNSVSPGKAALKRGCDIIGAAVGIVLSLPLMLIIAIAIKLNSPGPVTFTQIRLGRKGVPFIFYKFRSMYINMDDRIHRDYVAELITGNYANTNQGDTKKPFYKIKCDPRVTPVGRFIRKSSFDELPQLFNVLKGEMSLVGPRPPIPYESVLYESWHLRRILEIKPGITGLWQVEGRSSTSFDDMVRLDLRYINDQSLLLDLKILLKTVKVVVRWIGAA
jgi:lipopolysaccharide/colanic/teichoic acid biosynthesis glycosyltransferase